MKREEKQDRRNKKGKVDTGKSKQAERFCSSDLGQVVSLMLQISGRLL